MKKILALLLVLVMALSLVACGGGSEKEPADNAASGGYDYNAIPNEMTAEDGKYQIAFVTDVGTLMDKSFNQGTWEGVKRYAHENGKAYKYYQPANGDAATDDDRYNAMKAAVDNGAEIIVAAGFMQKTALLKAGAEFADTKFVFIDGEDLGMENVVSINFQEEQSGYLAGYAIVQEGFTKLGFTGGGGGTNPACCRFGYGFVQGAQAAAAEKGVNVEMNYSWEYGATFTASAELQTMLNGWYTNGTEVIFCCGGSMCQSAFAAAGANDGYVIGVDVDQSNQSEYVITSALKGLQESVMIACDSYYSDKWVSGVTNLGAKDDAVGLPVATWSLENFTVEQYNTLFAAMKDGSVVVDANYENGLVQENFANVTLHIG